jgi:hypothetical protein
VISAVWRFGCAGCGFLAASAVCAFLVLAAVMVVANSDPQTGRVAGMTSPVLGTFTTLAWDRTGRAAQVA